MKLFKQTFILTLFVSLGVGFLPFAIAESNANQALENHRYANPIPATVLKEDAPGPAALYIIYHSLNAIRKLKDQKNDDVNKTQQVLKEDLSPYVDISSASEFALRSHWNSFDAMQKKIFEEFISQSIISDYANIIAVSDSDLSNIKIVLDSDIKQQGNKAIVGLLVEFNTNNKPTSFSVRMIKLDSWKLYDLVFSGVSLMKSYRSRFDSQIERRGVDKVVKRLAKSLQ